MKLFNPLKKMTRQNTVEENPPTQEEGTPHAARLSCLSGQLARYAPLLELQRQKQLIEVLTDERGRSLQSMVLDVDFERSLLIIDDLFPRMEHHQAMPGDMLFIRHHLSGQQMNFACQLIGIEARQGGPVYILALPDQVSYGHRRLWPRVNPPAAMPLSARLISPNRIPWHARVLNISAGGMRVAVGGQVSDQLLRGTILPRCELDLHHQVHVECRAQVRSYRYERRPYGHTQISLEFVELPKERQQLLERLISSLANSNLAA